jgi:hypothetical protein
LNYKKKNVELVAELPYPMGRFAAAIKPQPVGRFAAATWANPDRRRQ